LSTPKVDNKTVFSFIGNTIIPQKVRKVKGILES